MQYSSLERKKEQKAKIKLCLFQMGLNDPQTEKQELHGRHELEAYIAANSLAGISDVLISEAEA